LRKYFARGNRFFGGDNNVLIGNDYVLVGDTQYDIGDSTPIFFIEGNITSLHSRVVSSAALRLEKAVVIVAEKYNHRRRYKV